MKTKTIFFLSLAIIIFSTAFMIILREVPILSPWKNWKVLSVSKDIPEQQVLKELSNLSINTVVTESSQDFTVATNLAPVLPSEFNFYKNNIYRFFYDKNFNFRLYYIPKSVTNKTLKNLSFDYTIDLQASFPYFSFILTIISYVLLLFLIKNKLKFGFTALPLILYTIVFPDFNSLIISLFSFVIIYFIDKYENRKSMFSSLVKNCFVFLSCLVCIISCVLGGLKGTLLFIFALLSAVGFYLIFTITKNYFENKANKLKFVKIVSAKHLNFNDKKTFFTLLGLSVFILLGALSYLLIPSISDKTNKDTPLLIPTPLEYTNTRGFSIGSYTNLQTKKSPTELPDLGDYISQLWNATVFPYIPLAKNKGYISNVTPNSSVKTVEYFENNGIIEKKSVEVAVFTKDFINSALEKIKSYDKPVIENVLLDQESFCAADFGNVKRTTSLTLILFIISILFSSTEIYIFCKYYKIGS